jgi:hypothetical protein
MKLSKLIENLQKLQERHEGVDVDIYFSVNDYYGVYGKSANFLGERENAPFWEGTSTILTHEKDGGSMRIELSLAKDLEGKKAKITYR